MFLTGPSSAEYWFTPSWTAGPISRAENYREFWPSFPHIRVIYLSRLTAITEGSHGVKVDFLWLSLSSNGDTPAVELFACRHAAAHFIEEIQQECRVEGADGIRRSRPRYHDDAFAVR